MTEPVKKNPRGRPRRYLEERPAWTIRLDAPLADQIKEMAKEYERSLAEICEGHIRMSFQLEEERLHLNEEIGRLQNLVTRGTAAQKIASDKLKGADNQARELQRTISQLLEQNGDLIKQNEALIKLMSNPHREGSNT